MAWSTMGTRATVVQPKTRARTITILGAISSGGGGIVNMKVRVPYQERSLVNQRQKKTVGTVLGHYFNFMFDILDVLDQHEQFKGHSLIMDNASIHISYQIEKLIVSREYGCVHLPPYSPELNPIEQFWSVVKSKVKREREVAEGGGDFDFKNS